MKAKAKSLYTGEWVEGYYEYDPCFTTTDHFINQPRDEGYCNQLIEIDPKTICQQVRGTDFFEGDVVTIKGESNKDEEWFLVYEQYQWWLQLLIGDESDSIELTYEYTKEAKPTGKNIHD